MVIIGLLFLVLFGPNKLPSMARDLGRFVNEAQRCVDEFKSEISLMEEKDDRPTGEKAKKKEAVGKPR